MSTDIYIEDSVNVTNNGAKTMYLLSMICLAASFFGMMFVTILFGIPFVLFIFLTVYFYYERHVAYDYTYTNGLFEIAKVRNNVKRKLLFSEECEKLEFMADSECDDLIMFENNGDYKTLKVYVGDESRNLWVAFFNSDGRKTKIMFEPGEELVKAIKRQYPSKVKYIERKQEA